MALELDQQISMLRRLARWTIFGYRRLRTRIRFQSRRRNTITSNIGLREGRLPITCISLLEHWGDIVACEPVARAVRAQWPRSKVVWCVRQHYASLVDQNPDVDEVLTVDSLYEWGLWTRSRVFDNIIDLNVEGRPDFLHGTTHRNIHGDRQVTIENFRSHGGLLKSFSKAAGLKPLNDAPRLQITESTKCSVDALGLPNAFVAIHCCSSAKLKDWSEAKWRELIVWLWTSWRLPTIEVGSASQFAPTLLPSLRSVCGLLDLLESAEVIRRSRLFIGVDSGPAHVANAVGTPGVILLSNWVPFSGRYGDGTLGTLIQQASGPVADIPTARVISAVDFRLSTQEETAKAASATPPTLSCDRRS